MPVGTEYDHPSLRREIRGLVISRRGQTLRIASGRRNSKNLELTSYPSGIGDQVALRGPYRPDVIITLKSQTSHFTGTNIQNINLGTPGAIGDKGQLFPVRRPGGRDINSPTLGQLADGGSIAAQLEDLGIALYDSGPRPGILRPGTRPE